MANEKLTIEQIIELQAQYGVTGTQNRIIDGSIWGFEGSAGRFAMDCLKSGVCFLGEKVTKDYYGNIIPPRGVLDEGSKGSLELSQDFWGKVNDSDFEYIENLEEMFGTHVLE